MKCPKCGHEGREGGEFSRECGASLSTGIACPRCQYASPPGSEFCDRCGHSLTDAVPSAEAPSTPSGPEPTFFADGRYGARRLLGVGGKKRVYFAHDTVVDRDVAFALIRTEKLDKEGRAHIRRDGQAMGRLGDHPSSRGIIHRDPQPGNVCLTEDGVARAGSLWRCHVDALGARLAPAAQANITANSSTPGQFPRALLSGVGKGECTR